MKKIFFLLLFYNTAFAQMPVIHGVIASSAGTSAAPVPYNVALSSNGGTASVSSIYGTDYPASSVINGDRKGLNWGGGGGWNSGSSSPPHFVQVDFNSSKTISEIDVITLQDNYASPSEPTLAMTFTLFGNTDFDVQYWTGTVWSTITSVAANNKIWRQLTFTPVTTTKVRINITGSVDGYGRIIEMEAWGY
jgi:hypothetical protein